MSLNFYSKPLLFILCVTVGWCAVGNAANLGERADKIKDYVEYFASINTLRVQLKVSFENFLEEEKGYGVMVGTYTLQGNRTDFEYSAFSGGDQEECEKKIALDQGGFGRKVRTPERVYWQSGFSLNHSKSHDVSISPGGADLHPKEPVHIYERMESLSSRLLDRIFGKDPSLRGMLPESVTLEDGTRAEKYRIRSFQDPNGNYTLYVELYFAVDNSSPLPIHYRGLTRRGNTEELGHEYMIKVNPSSPLGFDELTSVYYAPGNQPKYSTHLILTEPEVNVPVFGDEFNFHVKPGSKVTAYGIEGLESFVAEEDRVIKP